MDCWSSFSNCFLYRSSYSWNLSYQGKLFIGQKIYSKVTSMEKIIEKLEKELREVAEGKTLKPLREKFGEEITVCFLRVVVSALQWTSVGYHSALRLAGMKFGKRLGEGSERTELSLVSEEIKRIMRALRGGRVEVEILSESREAELKIYDSPCLINIPNVLQSLCLFEEGFIEGYIDGVIAKNGPLAVASKELSIERVSVEEKRCVGLGDEYCSFLIKF